MHRLPQCNAISYNRQSSAHVGNVFCTRFSKIRGIKKREGGCFLSFFCSLLSHLYLFLSSLPSPQNSLHPYNTPLIPIWSGAFVW